MTPAKTNAAASPSAAIACSQPQIDAKNDPSNGVNVPGSNPIAIVMVWYGATSLGLRHDGVAIAL